MIITSGKIEDMKTTQELLKKSANLQASIPPRQKLDLSRFIEARQMS